LRELLKVEPDEWAAQLDQVQVHFDRFGEKLPQEFKKQMTALEARLDLHKENA